jgi:hypothetical protein
LPRLRRRRAEPGVLVLPGMRLSASKPGDGAARLTHRRQRRRFELERAPLLEDRGELLVNSFLSGLVVDRRALARRPLAIVSIGAISAYTSKRCDTARECPRPTLRAFAVRG